VVLEWLVNRTNFVLVKTSVKKKKNLRRSLLQEEESWDYRQLAHDPKYGFELCNEEIEG